MAHRYPTYEEWLAGLPDEQRQRTVELVERFRARNCDNPEDWARSEISENFAQFARFLILQNLWYEQIESWVDNPDRWIKGCLRGASSIECLREAPSIAVFAEAAAALRRLQQAGAATADPAAVARYVAYSTAFGVLNRIDEGRDHYAGDGNPGWKLMETDPEDKLTGRDVGGLHESLLEFGEEPRNAPPGSKKQRPPRVESSRMKALHEYWAKAKAKRSADS